MTMRDNERDARTAGEGANEMTDKTERDALVALANEMDRHIQRLPTTGARMLGYYSKRLREALAAPAEGVDVEGLRKIADGIDPKIGTMGCAETARRIRALIDSAGGAKDDFCGKPKRADRALDACACATLTYTPQPAEGDGAVADALMVVNDAANDARHAGDYAKANALVRARVTLYRASTRQAATAVVPDAPLKVFDSGPWIYEPDGVRFSGQQLDGAAFAEYRRLLAAAPAAPKGVVDEAMVSRAASAYVESGLGGSICSHSAMRAALTVALNPEPQS